MIKRNWGVPVAAILGWLMFLPFILVEIPFLGYWQVPVGLLLAIGVMVSILAIEYKLDNN